LAGIARRKARSNISEAKNRAKDEPLRVGSFSEKSRRIFRGIAPR
jgi:hypothetical protein